MRLTKAASWQQCNRANTWQLTTCKGAHKAAESSPWQQPGQRGERPTEEQDALVREHWLQRQMRRERSAAALQAAPAAAAPAERCTVLTPPLLRVPILHFPCMQANACHAMILQCWP